MRLTEAVLVLGSQAYDTDSASDWRGSFVTDFNRLILAESVRRSMRWSAFFLSSGHSCMKWAIFSLEKCGTSFLMGLWGEVWEISQYKIVHRSATARVVTSERSGLLDFIFNAFASFSIQYSTPSGTPSKSISNCSLLSWVCLTIPPCDSTIKDCIRISPLYRILFYIFYFNICFYFFIEDTQALSYFLRLLATFVDFWLSLASFFSFHFSTTVCRYTILCKLNKIPLSISFSLLRWCR